MCDVDIMMIGHFAKDRLVIDGASEIASAAPVAGGPRPGGSGCAGQ